MARKSVAFTGKVNEPMEDNKIMPVIEAEVNPMIHLLFDFFLDPRATPLGYAYGLFLTLLVSLHLLIVGLETCDGPNQYPDGDRSHATYKFLMTDEEYWTATCCVTIPLVIDAAFRIILLICVFTAENPILRRKLMRSTFNMTLTALDFISLVPFCLEAGYLRPNHIIVSSGTEVLYEVIDILIVNRIFRVTKDLPAIWAIRIALARAVPHLVIPFFVFLMFNITAAVGSSVSCGCSHKTLLYRLYFSLLNLVTMWRPARGMISLKLCFSQWLR
jgi:hypothetical protein